MTHRIRLVLAATLVATAGLAAAAWAADVTLTETGEGERIRAVLEPIARSNGATVQQIALAWHLHHSPAALPIPGTTSPVHLRENLAAATIRLAPEEVETITALAPEA